MTDGLTHLGHCGLTDHPGGQWREATCDEYIKALEPVPEERRKVWSTLTDLVGRFGPPTIFTEWGTDAHPVGAHFRHPDSLNPCGHIHAIWEPTHPTDTEEER